MKVHQEVRSPVAKDPKEEHPATHPTHAGHAHKEAEAPAHKASEPGRTRSGAGGTSYVVTFPGQQPCTVQAGNEEEAVEKAKKELGVVSSETPPEVVKVETG